MQSMVFGRAASRGLRLRGAAQQRMGVATLAAFKTPRVANEPNVSMTRFFFRKSEWIWKRNTMLMKDCDSITMPRAASSARA